VGRKNGRHLRATPIRPLLIHATPTHILRTSPLFPFVSAIVQSWTGKTGDVLVQPSTSRGWMRRFYQEVVVVIVIDGRQRGRRPMLGRQRKEPSSSFVSYLVGSAIRPNYTC
jgi:hypothetical protein